MVIYFGADHRGFALKEKLKDYVKGLGYEIFDLGNAQLDPADDYPVYADLVAKKVAEAPEENKGVVLCGSGSGAAIAANKEKSVRAALALSTDQVFDSRHDDNVNVLALAADFTSPEDAQKLIRIFLETPYAKDERFERRLKEIKDIEKNA